VLSTSLTTQLNANLAPVTAALPPALQAELSPERFRNSSSVAEGSNGSQIDLGTALARATEKQFAEERKLVQSALGEGDLQARNTLISDQRTSPALRELLSQPPATDRQALGQALALVDTEQQQAIAQAQAAGKGVTDAVKLSFANSIGRIYVYACWLAGVAFLLTALWLPELPLRKTNRVETPVFE